MTPVGRGVAIRAITLIRLPVRHPLFAAPCDPEPPAISPGERPASRRAAGARPGKTAIPELQSRAGLYGETSAGHGQHDALAEELASSKARIDYPSQHCWTRHDGHRYSQIFVAPNLKDQFGPFGGNRLDLFFEYHRVPVQKGRSSEDYEFHYLAGSRLSPRTAANEGRPKINSA